MRIQKRRRSGTAFADDSADPCKRKFQFFRLWRRRHEQPVLCRTRLCRLDPQYNFPNRSTGRMRLQIQLQQLEKFFANRSRVVPPLSLRFLEIRGGIVSHSPKLTPDTVPVRPEHALQVVRKGDRACGSARMQAVPAKPKEPRVPGLLQRPAVDQTELECDL